MLGISESCIHNIIIYCKVPLFGTIKTYISSCVMRHKRGEQIASIQFMCMSKCVRMVDEQV